MHAVYECWLKVITHVEENYLNLASQHHIQIPSID